MLKYKKLARVTCKSLYTRWTTQNDQIPEQHMNISITSARTTHTAVHYKYYISQNVPLIQFESQAAFPPQADPRPLGLHWWVTLCKVLHCKRTSSRNNTWTSLSPNNAHCGALHNKSKWPNTVWVPGCIPAPGWPLICSGPITLSSSGSQQQRTITECDI